jgi:uridine kinase
MALCSVTDCFFGVGFIGMMGSGKTTVGRVLSKSLGYYFFDKYFSASKALAMTSYLLGFCNSWRTVHLQVRCMQIFRHFSLLRNGEALTEDPVMTFLHPYSNPVTSWIKQ